MSRTLKGTRARGLPPKVLLSQRQDATGSFPTVWRTASDNRTGKYPVFFNDNKVVPFNQYEAADYDSNFLIKAADDVAAGVRYVEKVENIGAVETGGTKTVTYPTAFAGSPIVVISELSSANGDSSQNVNVFLSASNLNNFTVKFSSQFTGSFVYRAAYDPSPGTLRVVERKPRYPNAFTRFTVKQTALTASNTTDITFNDFGDDTAENFVTFFDDSGNGQADIWPNITTQTRTLVALTASSIATATVEFQRFHGLHNRGIIYPLGMNQSAILTGLSQENQIEMYGSVSFISGAVVNQPTKWIVASGSMKKNVADTFVTFTPGQNIQSFRDNANPAIDGKISSSANGINPFYATGSAVGVTGQGFQQPLWSKSKIEIDLTPSVTQTFTASFGYTAAGSYPMFYWNPSTKQYEGLGNGVGLESDTADLAGLKNFLEEKPIGFGGCLDNGGLQTGLIDYAFKIRTRPISNFGFPYHPKFEATSSQLIDMNNYISEPFLLEKILLEFSGSISIPNSPSTNSCIQTFFLLNQRSYILSKSIGEQIISYATGTLLAPWTASFTTSSYSGQTYRDLVDYMQVAFYKTDGYGPNGLAQSPRELNFFGTPDAIGPTNFIISSSCKSPIKFKEGLQMFFSGATTSKMFFVEKSEFPGRNGVYEVNGREWVTSYENPAIVGTGSYALGSGPLNIININNNYTKLNPYILLPTDKLTFGGQLPLSIFGILAGDRSSITFSPQGINKITLYGSSLRVNPETNQLEEHHDTLNQLLSSDSIHENLG